MTKLEKFKAATICGMAGCVFIVVALGLGKIAENPQNAAETCFAFGIITSGCGLILLACFVCFGLSALSDP